MQIAYHIGVSCTDGEMIARALNRSVKALAQADTQIPPTARYRKALREAIEAQVSAPAPPEARAQLLRGMFGDAPLPARIILSNPNFLATPMRALEGGIFYGNAAFKVAAMRALFPQDALEFHMGLRNPATLLPALSDAAQVVSLGDYLGPLDPEGLRWSDVIEQMRDAAPDCPLTLWANEDTALIWHDILKSLGGREMIYTGRLDLLATLMPRDGLDRLQAYLSSHPPQTPAQEHRVIGAFLAKFVPLAAVTEEFEIPGWDGARVARMTAQYEADLDRIAGIDGVTLLRA